MEEIKGEVKESVSEKELEKRKKKIIHFIKQKTDWIVYGILAIIISISVFIRTRPIPKLKDITTGTWTLGPDLDPFLFLRWAQYIFEHGKLFVIDTLRYVPLADICSGASCTPVKPSSETILLPYLIAWFTKFLSIFNSETTVTYAAIIFPVVMAVLTGIAFFLFARKIFYKENKKIANIIALIATAFFVLIPSILPRTIAGIPEKESAAFFFIFMAFYFFLEAFSSDKLKKGLIFTFLAGLSTAFLGLVSGFVDLVLVSIPAVVLFLFLLGKIDGKRFLFFGGWLISSLLIAMPFSERFSLGSIISSSSTMIALAVLFVLLIDFFIFKKKIFGLYKKFEKIKLPKPIISFLTLIIIGIIFSIIFSGNIIHLVKDIISSTINPISLGRFSVTVAENKAAYFITDWIDNFGPIVFNIPLYFWMLIIGAGVLFNSLISSLNKKEKILLIISYMIMLLAMVFSKYSSSSILNGKSIISLLMYFGGVLSFIGCFGYVYYTRYKKGEFSSLKKLNFSYIFYFVILTISIISARGAIRLIMVLGAVSPIVVAFLIVKSSQKYLIEKDDMKKLFLGIIVLLILLSSIFTVWVYYNSDKNLAENYAPSIYTQQWQKAMSWVRDNTPKNAVFAHWWDYGYWVQSIGERATILDGGNALGYWDYFMGRNVLTSTNERDALDFLYAHNGTHLLIDSSDIGKYGAFSSIGSNENYDRYSFIPTIFLDETQTQEKSTETDYVYQAGFSVDEDILINQNGQDLLLPKQTTGLAGIITKFKIDGEVEQPTIVFSYNGQQYQLPLRYIYINKQLYDFKTGLNAGIFVFPVIKQNSNGGISISANGAALYLSRRVIDSQLTKLYLFNEDSNYFKLAHSEDSLIVEGLKQQGADLGDFAYYSQAGGFQGPIKIWEVNYPSDIKLNSTYLETDYPEELDTINPDY